MFTDKSRQRFYENPKIQDIPITYIATILEAIEEALRVDESEGKDNDTNV